MAQEVELSHVEDLFEDLEYPVDRSTAADEFADVMLLLADGEVNLGEMISDSTSDTFDSPEDLVSELHNVLPRGAVGEPYQSEGEG